jgi:ubiquilin
MIGSTNTNTNVDYKDLYKDQLLKLKDMGFTNEEVNIDVLKKSGGNIDIAVEKLLNMLG